MLPERTWPSTETDTERTHILLWLWGGIFLFALTFSALALNRHAAFQSNGFDLGNVNQALWNTAQGRPLAFTNMAPVQNRLALHVEPILFLLVPFYWLGIGGPEFLLVVQAVVVALGAWPLYLIARPKIGAWGGLAAGLAYLLYPALEAAVLYDFHAVTLFPTLVLFAFYWLERAMASPGHNRQAGQVSPVSYWGRFALFIGLAMACKEDMGFIVAMLGLYIWLVYRRWGPALAILVTGVAWSLLAIFGVQALFGGNVQSDRYTWLAEAVMQPALIWDHLWRQVDLPGYLWGMLAPTGGLALLFPLALLPTLPSLAINLLSSHGLQWRLEEFHYAAPIAPFVFIAAIQGIQLLTAGGQGSRGARGRGRKKSLLLPRSPAPLLVLLLVASLSYHYYRGFSPLARPFRWREVAAHQQLGRRMADQIDPVLPLFAPLTLNPHVSSRRILHQTFDSLAADDWLWLDVTALPNENGVQQAIRDRLLPNYSLVQADDGYLLLQPGPAPAALPATFYTFARPTVAITPQYPVSIFFGEALELVGYDLIFNRAEEVQVRTYWRARAPLPGGLTPALFLLDKRGAFIGATDAAHAPATLVWYPPERWPPGELVIVDFNSLNWYTRDRDAYRLGLGVSPVADPWDVGARWRPEIVRTPFANRLTPEGTVVELAHVKQVAGLPEGGPLARQTLQPVTRRRADVTFGGQIRLAGYNPPRIRLTDKGLTVQLDLVWQGLGEPRGDYVRFVHLVGPDGVLRGQHDSSPVNGTYPTSLWAQGEFVPETVEVPLEADRPAGAYTLHVGLYDPISGQRLTDEVGRDHYEIMAQLAR
jgi:uncharacterized membrane protein